MQTPQKFRTEFLDLPPRMQSKVLEILRRHGGDNFNADALLEPPKSSFAGQGFDENNFEGEKEFETTSRFEGFQHGTLRCSLKSKSIFLNGMTHSIGTNLASN